MFWDGIPETRCILFLVMGIKRNSWESGVEYPVLEAKQKHSFSS